MSLITRLERRLARLERARHLRPSEGRVERALDALATARLPDAESLIRFHEALLFLRAYPQTRGVLARVERGLSSVAKRVARLQREGADLSPLDTPELSGIAGTALTTDFSYDLAVWLARRFARRVSIDWDLHEATERLRASWPEFLPALEEEALEDANVPYLEYLKAAGHRGESDLAWLLSRIRGLPLPPREKAERYDALGLSLRWELGDGRVTRTRMRRTAKKLFFHERPLLTRRDVSLEAELASPPLAVRRLSRREGQAVVEMTRESTALRYREYYGFTYGDPSWVLAADAGRGLEIFLFGLEPSRRLPLRAGFAGFLVKNGVPVGYVEALAFLERMEVGFNVYYAFREGESAWMFARVLKFLNQALGVTSFSMDPYQLGHENEEAIHSGAFWFYRKLGFRSTDPRVRALTEREEKKLAANPAYRTPPHALRRLAASNLLYEVGRREAEGGRRASEWDLFHIRNLPLAVLRRMARHFGGDAGKIRRASESSVARALGVNPRRWRPSERRAFEDLSLVLALIPDLPRWSGEEKTAVAAIIRAKAAPGESRYLHLMRRHARLRAALVELGSARSVS